MVFVGRWGWGEDWIGYRRLWRDNCRGVGYKEDLGFLEIFPLTTFYRQFTIPWGPSDGQILKDGMDGKV